MCTNYCIALLLMSIAGTTVAQQTESHLVGPGKRGRFAGLSHIEVDLGQKNALVVGFTTFAQLTARQNVDSVLRLFVRDYQLVMDSTRNPLEAKYILLRLGDINRTLDVRHTPQPTASFRFMAGKTDPVLVKTQQDTLQIVWSSAATPLSYYDFSFYMIVNNLADVDRILQNGGVNEKLQEAMKSVRGYKAHDLTNPKMSFDLRYRREGTSIGTNFINPGLAKSPFLSFQPTIGVGLIRSQWVPSVNLDVQFVPTRFKGVGYSVGFLGNFFFQNSADYRSPIQGNSFLSVGVAFYRKNPDGRTPAFDRLVTSMSVGILVKRSGDYFAPNTIRFGTTIYQKGFIKIQTEVYMNGMVKQVYPGVRIGFGL